MKVVVAYKWARNQESATVRKGGQVDWGAAKMVAGDDDHAALAAAKAVAEASGGTVTGLTIGNGDASWASARGVDRSVSVDDAPFLADNTATAAILAAAVRHLGDVDVVVIGDSDQAPGAGAALAGHLGWPALAGVATATARDGRVEATRRSGGTQETYSVATPAVLIVAAAGSEPKAPGMKELLMARKRPIDRIAMADLAASDQAGFVSVGTAAPEVAGATMIPGDAEAAAQALVAQLRKEGVI